MGVGRYIDRGLCYKLIWDLSQYWSENPFLTAVRVSLLYCPAFKASLLLGNIVIDALIGDDMEKKNAWHNKSSWRLEDWRLIQSCVCVCLRADSQVWGRCCGRCPRVPTAGPVGSLESFMSKRVPSVKSLLWRGRGEQNWSNQNGYKAAALCVCITGNLHTVFEWLMRCGERTIMHYISFYYVY